MMMISLPIVHNNVAAILISVLLTAIRLIHFSSDLIMVFNSLVALFTSINTDASLPINP